MKFDPEFKNAISLLSSKEKDKLILRLLKRDLILASQLRFELLREESMLERRAKMEDFIREEIAKATKSSSSLKSLLMAARYLSSEITKHVKITRDKCGEVSLNLLMLTELLENNNEWITKAKLKDYYTISIYAVARTFKVLTLVKALHEDYMAEFESGLQELGRLFGENPKLMDIAVRNKFDLNWLTQTDIPDDIAEIHKKVRSMGFLK